MQGKGSNLIIVLMLLYEELVKLPEPANSDDLAKWFGHLRQARRFHKNKMQELLAEFFIYLEQSPEQQQKFVGAFIGIFEKQNFVPLFTESGIAPNTNFTVELLRKLLRKMLPEAWAEYDARNDINGIFNYKEDHEWLLEIAPVYWKKIFDLFAASGWKFSQSNLYDQFLESVTILAQRIAAYGLEPELSHRHYFEEKLYSYFIELNNAVHDYAKHLVEYNGVADPQHLERIILQIGECENVLFDVRQRKDRYGASIELTFLLTRIQQSLDRLRLLLEILCYEGQLLEENIRELIVDLVRAENLKNSVRQLVNENIGLLAYRVVDHAGQTGEHYVTNTLPEYWAFFKASLKGGCVVAFMAMIKLLLYYAKFPPFWQAFTYSMNYSFGFMFMHVTHSALATKQPAMTASHIASSLDSKRKNDISLEGLVIMLGKVFRSQFISFMGNLITSFGIALILALLWRLVTGSHIADPAKAAKMIEEIHPFTSGSLIFASIAGFYLFVAGLISGYFDNLVIYRHIPQRLNKHKFLKRVLGKKYLQKFSDYLEHNLGGLAGNFFFGIFLGSTATVGYLFGAHIDIRHITFSNANFAIALTGLNFQVPWYDYLWSILGISLIGFFNFAVSFTLAMMVSLRARKITREQLLRIFVILRKYVTRHPKDFIYPPKEERGEDVLS